MDQALQDWLPTVLVFSIPFLRSHLVATSQHKVGFLAGTNGLKSAPRLCITAARMTLIMQALEMSGLSIEILYWPMHGLKYW